MSDSEQRFLATAPRGLSDLLARELAALGATRIAERAGSVPFEGALEVGYRACLWSRTASRVLLWLATLAAPSAEDFYQQARSFDWAAHIDPARTLACDFSGAHPAITHSHFGALRLKDAICDQLRAQCGRRPDVQLTRPAVRVVAHARGERISLWIDLAGEGLHRRGYRREAGEAPLRENLAAGVLLRARWDEAGARGAEFLDPLCGAGTLVIEAALIAAERAPGLTREYYGHAGWRGHDAALWERLRAEALERAEAAGRAGPGGRSPIRGSDADREAIAVARANAERAGVASLVQFEHRPLSEAHPSGSEPGLIVTNPPYGERLGDEAGARAVHAELGQVLRQRFVGWDAAILTAAPGAAAELKLRSYRVHELWNGPIPCRLIRIDLAAPGEEDLQSAQRQRAAQAAASAGARMFANRLRKNLKHLERQARRNEVSCYRLYDADMPEYAFAVDRYLDADTGAVHLHVQEYAPPASIDAAAARRRRQEALATLPAVLEVPPERIHLRLRERQRGAAQYRARREAGAGMGAGADASGRIAAGGGGAAGPERGARAGAVGAPPTATFAIAEGGLRFLVNLDEYLDTGLFLDNRRTRARLREDARGARFLNLFCYTGSASVYAAAGGARDSLSIDLSNRYLEWAEQNFRLNALDPAQHRLLRADGREWLRAAVEAAAAPRFELIFLDPPTFSNSKRMREVLDVQRDHSQLIEWCMRLLAAGGRLVFSTNAQRFRLQENVGERWRVRDISKETLPFDFERNPRIHRCFEITES